MIRLIISSLFLFTVTIGVAQGNKKAAKKLSSKQERIIEITTKFGVISLICFDATPKHKENFIKLAEDGFYNGTTFHRVIDNFMIQGGDPNSKDDNKYNDGQGGPGYTIEAEIRDTIKHIRGALASARMGDDVNPKRESSGSQFYIVQNPNGTPHLNGAYTVFGKVIKGMEVVDAIAKVKKNRTDRPDEDITMTMKVITLPKKKINKLYGTNLPIK